MPFDPEFRYFMGDDGGFFDDSGGGEDDYPEDDEQADPDDDPYQDEDEDEYGGGDGGEDGGGDDDDFSDPGSLLDLDDDVALSAGDFPNATEADFIDDDGSWTVDDYQQSAENLFGDHQYFGDTMEQQRAEEGYRRFDDPGFLSGFEEVAPGSSETVRLFERDGRLSAFGFVSAAMLEYLRMRYTGIDLSNL